MTIVFEELPNEPIVISILKPPLDPQRDAQVSVEAIARYLHEIKGNLYYISDTTLLDQVSFGDIVIGLATATQDKNGPLGDPRFKLYTVASIDMMRFAAESSSSGAVWCG